MKIKYIGKEREDYVFGNDRIDLVNGKTYEVLEIDPKMGWYRVVDESGEDYLYPPRFFEIVEK